MEIDWSQVKKRTLWHYEDLIQKLLKVLGYGFVHEHYNHTISKAISFEVTCETQREVDSYWERYIEGGEEDPCGWLVCD